MQKHKNLATEKSMFKKIKEKSNMKNAGRKSQQF